MPSIHTVASKGFSSAAKTYVAGRPGYPPEVAGWLRGVIGLGPGRTVLDLGSGTGKFLPYLRETQARVMAVEPVPAMLAQLAEQNPDVEALSGTADCIPLPDTSVDAVICAQAFHWFATAATLKEIRRVLKPAGVLGLIWNGRDESVEWVAALSEIIERFKGDAPRYLSGQWRRAFPANGFEFLNEQHFRNEHVGNPEQVIVDRTLSVSFIAALPPAEQDAVAREVRGLIAATPALAGRTKVAFPYATAAFAYRKVA